MQVTKMRSESFVSYMTLDIFRIALTAK